MTRPRNDSGSLLTIEKVLALKAVPLFAAIAEQELIEIAYIAEEIDVAAGERIIRYNELGTSLYVIVQGSARVHRDDQEIAQLGPREMFGELSALDPEPRSADVTALEDSVLLRIAGGALFDLMTEHGAVTRGVLGVLCRRLRAATEQNMRHAPPRKSAMHRVVQG